MNQQAVKQIINLVKKLNKKMVQSKYPRHFLHNFFTIGLNITCDNINILFDDKVVYTYVNKTKRESDKKIIQYIIEDINERIRQYKYTIKTTKGD